MTDMKPGDFSIALRIRHPSIDPAELTRHLGFEPQHSWRAGEPRRSSAGEVAEGAYRETYWVGLIPLMSPALPNVYQDVQMCLFFALLRMKRSAEFWRGIVAEGGTIECLIQVHSGKSFTLDLAQPLLSLLVQLKVGLSVDVDPARQTAVAA